MSEPKPMASLSSSLLARKGQAKPAMRPQGFGGFGLSPSGYDDLGWNDMGGPVEPRAAVEAEVVPLHAELLSVPDVAEASPVHVQQDEIEQRFEPLAAEPVVEPPFERVALEPVVREPHVAHLPAKRQPVGAKGKAAFTLRLDADRHVKLRMLSAVTRVSSQQLVVAALDAYLDGHPSAHTLPAA